MSDRSSSSPPVRWGILGTGMIARLFAEDLALVPDAELAAAGSRSADRADDFADTFGAPAAHGSYEALVTDERVDIVYIATPHSRHRDDTLLAIDAGKAVLCEKAFAVNAREAREMVDAARTAGTFLMEAMWTRFHPTITTVRRMIRDGMLGPVRTMMADISTIRPTDPDDRLFARDLAGGTLLDLGVYPVALAFDLFGTPDAVTSSAQMGPTDVDEQCAAIFSYDNGLQVVWQASFRADAGRGLTLAGPDGRLRNDRDWWKGTPFTWIPVEGDRQTVGEMPDGNGYQFEIAHVGNCLRDGRTESPVMPLDESVAIMDTLDALRADWGLIYPNDEA
jgi:predicted dehydrogenase